MRNVLLKTKTLKIKSKKFNKVRMKLRIIDTEFIFIDEKKKESTTIIQRGFGDNEKFVRSILTDEYKVSKESMDEIINFMSIYYRMNLEDLAI